MTSFLSRRKPSPPWPKSEQAVLWRRACLQPRLLNDNR
jgi:hypothetical protein